MKQKKKIVFILGRMIEGGPARDLLNIINFVDKKKYHITLILLQNGGGLYSEIRKDVSIKFAKPENLFNEKQNKSSIIKYCCWFIIKLGIRISSKAIKVLFSFNERYNWKITELFIKKDNEKFDLAISLVEGPSNYYLAKFVRADIKVGRVPTDYKVAKLNSNFDLKYFKKLDYIVTNSSINYNSLCEIFPNLKKKFLVVDTIVLPEYLSRLADMEEGFKDDFKGIRIVTLSRLDNAKGIDIAIKACQLLVEFGNKNFRWYVFGNGNKAKYIEMIEVLNLQNIFILKEPVTNPYPFVKQADIYVQSSRYEGNSNAVKEAKALHIPIVLTNFNTAKEHINTKEGIIAEGIDPQTLAESLRKMIENPVLRLSIINNLKSMRFDNRREFDKILQLIEDDDVN